MISSIWVHDVYRAKHVLKGGERVLPLEIGFGRTKFFGAKHVFSGGERVWPDDFVDLGARCLWSETRFYWWGTRFALGFRCGRTIVCGAKTVFSGGERVLP